MRTVLNVAAWMLVVFVAAVSAQVTIESKASSAGFYGMGGFTSTSKVMVQGDAKRSETRLKFSGAIMKHFSPKGTTIDITRLDKQLMWNFNDKDKKYTETTFAEMKELFESGKSMYDMPEQQEQENPEQEEMESEYEWQEPVVEIKKTGETISISGIKCDHYLATIMTIGTHKQTGKLDTMLFKGNFWNSPTTSSELQKAADFEKRLAEALGFDFSSDRGMAQFMQAFKEQASQLQDSMGEMKGYPLKMDMEYTVTTNAYAAEQAAAQEEESQESNDVDVTDVGGALGGFFGKKISKMAEKKVAPKADGGNKMLFQSSYEVTNIKTGNISADKFEVPSNYKLQGK